MAAPRGPAARPRPPGERAPGRRAAGKIVRRSPGLVYHPAVINRRDALKTIGGLAGAAGLSRLLAGCGDNVGGPDGITTIVYMMLENRSYDHYFGARSMLEGKPGDGLKMSYTCPDVNGAMIAPWEPTKDQMCDPDPPHGWDALHASFDGGKCDGFVQQHQMAHIARRSSIRCST